MLHVLVNFLSDFAGHTKCVHTHPGAEALQAGKDERGGCTDHLSMKPGPETGTKGRRKQVSWDHMGLGFGGSQSGEVNGQSGATHVQDWPGLGGRARGTRELWGAGPQGRG